MGIISTEQWPLLKSLPSRLVILYLILNPHVDNQEINLKSADFKKIKGKNRTPLNLIVIAKFMGVLNSSFGLTSV